MAAMKNMDSIHCYILAQMNMSNPVGPPDLANLDKWLRYVYVQRCNVTSLQRCVKEAETLSHTPPSSNQSSQY